MHSLYFSHHSLPPCFRWWQFLSKRAGEHYVLIGKDNTRASQLDMLPIFICFTEKPCDSQVNQRASGVILMLLRRYSNCTGRQGALQNKKISLLKMDLTRADAESVVWISKSRAMDTHFYQSYSHLFVLHAPQLQTLNLKKGIELPISICNQRIKTICCPTIPPCLIFFFSFDLFRPYKQRHFKTAAFKVQTTSQICKCYH